MIVPYRYYRGHWNDEKKRYEDDKSRVRVVGMEYFGDGEGYMGRCSVRDEGVDMDDREHASIWSVKIEPEHRGKGHGSMMMAETMDTLKGMGYDDVYLVCTGGITARKAYERAGFIMTQESPSSPDNGRMEWHRGGA